VGFVGKSFGSWCGKQTVENVLVGLPDEGVIATQMSGGTGDPNKVGVLFDITNATIATLLRPRAFGTAYTS
jgi:hypothetical protein